MFTFNENTKAFNEDREGRDIDKILYSPKIFIKKNIAIVYKILFHTNDTKELVRIVGDNNVSYAHLKQSDSVYELETFAKEDFYDILVNQADRIYTREQYQQELIAAVKIVKGIEEIFAEFETTPNMQILLNSVKNHMIEVIKAKAGIEYNKTSWMNRFMMMFNSTVDISSVVDNLTGAVSESISSKNIELGFKINELFKEATIFI